MGAALICYMLSILLLSDVFDPTVTFSWHFLLRVLIVTVVSCLPVNIGKWLQRRFAPSSYAKISG